MRKRSPLTMLKHLIYDKVIALIIVSVSISVSSPLFATTSTLMVLHDDWYKAGFSLDFDNPVGYQDRVSLYHTPSSVSSKKLRYMFRPAPQHIKDVLFSSHTNNPFRQLFHEVYDYSNRQRVNQCNFLGLKLNVSHNREAREWLIAAPLSQCLNVPTKLASDTHFWVLQQRGNSYRVLMESQGAVHLINNTSQEYKQIKTQVYNSQLNKQQQCGSGIVSWDYQQGAYVPTTLFPKITGCEQTLGTMNDKQRIQYVKDHLLSGMEKLTKQKIRRNSNGTLIRGQ